MNLKIELIKQIPLGVAIIGLVFLGIKSPETMGVAAISGLSGVIGGHYGALVPEQKRNDSDS